MSKERETLPPQFTLEDIIRVAKETALRDGRHAPIVVAEGSLNIALCEIRELPGIHREKVQRMRSAGFLVGQTENIGKLQQVFFVCEGWMSMGQKDQPPVLPPTEDPNRKEVLLIMQLALRDRRGKIVCLEMIRDTAGQLTALRDIAPPEEAKGGHVESLLLTAFVEGFLLGVRKGGN